MIKETKPQLDELHPFADNTERSRISDVDTAVKVTQAFEQFKVEDLTVDQRMQLQDMISKMKELQQKMASDNPYEQAEGTFQMLVFGKTESLITPDGPEFDEQVRKYGDFLKASDERTEMLKERYGDPLPEVLGKAGTAGYIKGIEDNDFIQDMPASMRQPLTSKFDSLQTYEEIKASIEELDFADDVKAQLRTDVEDAYAFGQKSANTLFEAIAYVEALPSPNDVRFEGGNTDVRRSHNPLYVHVPFHGASENELYPTIPQNHYGFILENLSEDSSEEAIKSELRATLLVDGGTDQIPNQEQFDQLVRDISADIQAVKDINAKLNEKYPEGLPKEVMQAQILTGFVNYDNPEYAHIVNDPAFDNILTANQLINSIQDTSLRDDVEMVITAGDLHNIRHFEISEALNKMVNEARYGPESSIKPEFEKAHGYYGIVPCDEHTLQEAKDDMGVKNPDDNLGTLGITPCFIDPALLNSP